MTATKAKKAKLNPADYAKFIEQIELADIRLTAIKAEVKAPLEKEAKYNTVCAGEAAFKTSKGVFTALATYRVRIVDPETKKPVAVVVETFAAEYRSELPMTDEIFAAFCQLNLPLNVWPYMRELTHNTFARMNIVGVVAPMLKLRIMSGLGKK